MPHPLLALPHLHPQCLHACCTHKLAPMYHGWTRYMLMTGHVTCCMYRHADGTVVPADQGGAQPASGGQAGSRELDVRLSEQARARLLCGPDGQVPRPKIFKPLLLGRCVGTWTGVWAHGQVCEHVGRGVDSVQWTHLGRVLAGFGAR